MNWYSFYIPETNPSHYKKWYSLMASEKRLRADSCRFEADRNRLVFGDMLAKLALSDFTGAPAESICFALSANGKPYATGISAEFNISHSGELIVCAVDSQKIGIDVEKIRPVPSRLVYRVCSEQECDLIFGDITANKHNMLADRLILERFYQVWTAKEAYCKYIGTGILTDLRQIPSNNAKIRTTIYGDYVISICCDHNQALPCSDGIWSCHREIAIPV